MEKYVKVGIEVPESSYLNDERGFSCCMLWLWDTCRAVGGRVWVCRRVKTMDSSSERGKSRVVLLEDYHVLGSYQ